jgi:hypothetical protein
MEIMDREEILQMKPDHIYEIRYLSGDHILSVTGVLDSLHPEDDNLIVCILRVVDFGNMISVKERAQYSASYRETTRPSDEAYL